MPGRRSRLLVIALALAPAVRPISDAAAESKPHERAIRIGAIVGAMALYVVSSTVAKDALAPDACRWCSVDSLDDRLREAAVWDDKERARLLSDLIGYGANPVAASGLLLIAARGAGPGWRTAYADDLIAMLEAVWGTQLATQLVKFTAGRQRPYAHYRSAPAPLSQEDNLSFISGHSSLTFSFAVSAGVIAQRRGYRLAPVIWTTGLATAATTAYLRMAADRHYLTDVLAGGAAGALGGALIPRLTGSLPARATLIPQPGGLALAGRF